MSIRSVGNRAKLIDGRGGEYRDRRAPAGEPPQPYDLSHDLGKTTDIRPQHPEAAKKLLRFGLINDRFKRALDAISGEEIHYRWNPNASKSASNSPKAGRSGETSHRTNR